MFSFRLALILIAFAPLAVPAQDAPVRIRDINANADGTRITGTWPTSCQPALRTWSHSSAGRMDILLADNASHCALGAHPFSLEVSEREQFSPVLPSDQVSPIHVFAARGSDKPELVGFALRSKQVPAISPDSGFWWPQGADDGSGNVLSLELQGNTLGIALLSHDDLSGAPVWYFGTSELQGQTAHASLSRLEDGSSPFFGMRVQPIPQPGVTVDIAFSSSTSARVWLSRPSPLRPGTLELATMHFARRSFSKDAQPQQWQGTWLVARDAPADDTASADSWPSRLDFSASQQIARRHVRLIGRQGDFALDCSNAKDGHGTAQQCTLHDAAGNTLARFDQVGLDRLDGQDTQGHAVVLLRPRTR
ncbi:MAG: hypothetical protein WCD66_13210 [Rhodanobacteraceae bacterium]